MGTEKNTWNVITPRIKSYNITRVAVKEIILRKFLGDETFFSSRWRGRLKWTFLYETTLRAGPDAVAQKQTNRKI